MFRRKGDTELSDVPGLHMGAFRQASYRLGGTAKVDCVHFAEPVGAPNSLP